MNISEIKESLHRFTGSECIYRNTLTRCLYTEGIRFIAEECKASWLVTDALVICRNLANKGHEFVTVKLSKDGTAGTILYDDGNGKKLYKQEYALVDFPLEEITLYFTNNTLLLPSEY